MGNLKVIIVFFLELAFLETSHDIPLVHQISWLYLINCGCKMVFPLQILWPRIYFYLILT